MSCHFADPVVWILLLTILFGGADEHAPTRAVGSALDTSVQPAATTARETDKPGISADQATGSPLFRPTERNGAASQRLFLPPLRVVIAEIATGAAAHRPLTASQFARTLRSARLLI